MCRPCGFLATDPTRLKRGLVASDLLTGEKCVEAPDASVLGAHTLRRDLLAAAV